MKVKMVVSDDWEVWEVAGEKEDWRSTELDIPDARMEEYQALLAKLREFSAYFQGEWDKTWRGEARRRYLAQHPEEKDKE